MSTPAMSTSTGCYQGRCSSGEWAAIHSPVAHCDALCVPRWQLAPPACACCDFPQHFSPARVGPFGEQAQSVLERIDAGSRGAFIDEGLDEEAMRVVAGATVLSGEDVLGTTISMRTFGMEPLTYTASLMPNITGLTSYVRDERLGTPSDPSAARRRAACRSRYLPWRKVSSRDQITWIGVPGNFLATARTMRTSSQLTRRPKLPPTSVW